jgi:hypothetical protein
MRLLLTLLLTLFMPQFTVAAVLLDDNLDNRASIDEIYAGDSGWQTTDSTYGDLATLESSGCRDGKCLRINWPVASSKAFGRLTGPVNSDIVHIRFTFKYSGNTSYHSKFLKLHGYGGYSPSNWANMTVNSGYYGWGQVGISYSDGANLVNDTDILAKYDGTFNGDDGSSGTVVVSNPTFYPQQDTWHTFEVLAKRNTDGNSDGYVKIWYDATNEADVYYHLENWKMRNDANPENWTKFVLGDYIQNPSGGEFYNWYDDIIVTTDTTYIGDPEDTGYVPTTQICYYDEGDGYGDGTSETVLIADGCSTDYYLSTALTATTGDCEPNNILIHPGATELLDSGVDENCDGIYWTEDPGTDPVTSGAYINYLGSAVMYDNTIPILP